MIDELMVSDRESLSDTYMGCCCWLNFHYNITFFLLILLWLDLFWHIYGAILEALLWWIFWGWTNSVFPDWFSKAYIPNSFSSLESMRKHEKKSNLCFAAQIYFERHFQTQYKYSTKQHPNIKEKLIEWTLRETVIRKQSIRVNCRETNL